jgi:hypothetical protein
VVFVGGINTDVRGGSGGTFGCKIMFGVGWVWTVGSGILVWKLTCFVGMSLVVSGPWL